MNQLSCTLDATTILEYTMQVKVFLFLMSKQNLKPPLKASNTLRIVENGLETKILWTPKVKRVKNSKKKPLNTIKVYF